MTEELPDPDPQPPEPYVIDGRMRQRPVPVWHWRYARTTLAVARPLDAWLLAQPVKPGELFGEAEFVLCEAPLTRLRLPLAFVPGRPVESDDGRVFALPAVAIDIILGPECIGHTHERVTACLDAGVGQVWVLNPLDSTMTVHRLGASVAAFNVADRLAGDPELPGFTAPVADFFR